MNMALWRERLTILDAGKSDGPRPATWGVIVHATRGSRPIGDEYQATINWFMNPAGPCAHIVIAADGRVTQFEPFDVRTWHALDPANIYYLGVELEGPSLDYVYTDAQYHVLASWIRDMAATFGFPIDRAHIIGHSEEANGIRQGKTDPGPTFDWDYLMACILDATDQCGNVVSLCPPYCGDEQPPNGTAILGGLMLIGAGAYLLLRKAA